MTKRIALLNMMPDAAMKATDRQFVRQMSSHPEITLYPFTFAEIPRGAKAADYIAQNYHSFDHIQGLAPQALIITGANVSDPRLEVQVFWDPLQKVLAWSQKDLASTLCSCLASHAVMQFRYGQKRSPLPEKIWGVYDHQVMLPSHPLAKELPATVPVPQSRFNQVTPEQFEAAGLQVVISSTQAGVHLVTSPDNSLVLMQGHPEYDPVSLLKEYRRECQLFASGIRLDKPPLPHEMVSPNGIEYLRQMGPDFSETKAEGYLHKKWWPGAHGVFKNWLELIFN